MKNEFQKIQVDLEEKTKMNKKLYEDFNNLYFYLDKESEFVSKLKKEKMIYEESKQELLNENQNFDKNMNSLNNSKNEYIKHIDFLTKQNMILNDKIKEEEKQLSLLQQEKENLKEKNKEISIINNNKSKQIKINSNEIDYFQSQLNISNNNINNMLETLNELDNRYQKLKIQYDQCIEDKDNLEKKKFNNDKIYQELIGDIDQKEKNINNSIEKLDKMSLEKEKLFNYNSKMNNDLERYQNHIYELANQNEKLVKEIEKFKKIEQMINEHIKYRKNKEVILNQEMNLIENKIGKELKNYMNNPEKSNNELENINNNNYINIELYNNSDKQDLNENDIYDINEQNRQLNLYQNDEYNYNNINELQNHELQNFNENYNYSGFQKELELEQNYD